MSRITYAVLLLALGACGVNGELQPPAGAGAGIQVAEGVMLTTDRQSYSAGSDVRLELRNGSAAAIGVNVCMSTLERRNGAWARSTIQPDEICTAELRLLEPGGSASHTFTLPQALTPGEYRFQTDVERMETGQREPITSTPFRVEG
jgi:hypothetical protein